MKFLPALLVCAASALTVGAATRPTPVPPIYVNESPLAPPEPPPQVDAAVFINRSSFFVSNSLLFPTLVATPWNAQSVQVWTNTGSMIGRPGFRFDYTPNPAHLSSKQRRKRGALSPQAALIFDNSGEISASDSLTIHAKRINNPGILSGDINTRLRIYGDAGVVDLSRGAVRVGDLPLPDCTGQSNFIFGPFFFGTDPAVNYRYLDSGTGGFLPGNTNRIPLFLPSLGSNNLGVVSFAPPAPQIPLSQYRLFQSIFPGAPATNVLTNFLSVLTNCGSYDSFVHVRTNNIGTNFLSRNITVVLVPTNGSSENVSVGVAFPTNAFSFFGTVDPIVEYRIASRDVITQEPTTSFITFRNAGAAVFRGHDCEFDLADQPNAVFTPDLFYTTNFVTNVVSDYSYTVSQVHVGNTNSTFFTPTAAFTLLGQSPAASDPTNYPGRIEIAANTLDLTQARLRAENGIFIRATNLVGNESAQLDSPFVSFDVGTTNSSMVISNLIIPVVSRPQAEFNSWSGAWQVQQTNGTRTISTTDTNGNPTNIVVSIIETLNYRVLVLGACVSAEAPTVVHRFHLNATNMVLQDDLAINASLLLKGKSVTIGENGSLNLPRGANVAFTNFQHVLSFTNHGLLNTPGSAFFGVFEDGYVQKPLTRAQQRSKKPQPPRLTTYDNVVNHGTIAAASVKARAARVESSGTLVEPAVILGSNGVVALDGGTLLLSNTVVQAQSELRLTAGNMLATGTHLSAGSTNGLFGSFLPGALVIDATNSLTDGGVNAGNLWRVTGGVRLTRRPSAPGDLLGTQLESQAGTFAQTVHMWAGEDRGASPAGFSNNLAIGRLVLDGRQLNRFRFRGVGANNALYVDYLEFRNNGVASGNPTNYNFAFSVDPGFTIYVADSNIDLRDLFGASGGRIQWVPGYVGANSSTNLTYPNGITYTFNAAVVRSSDRDDDGDGVANVLDCTPVPVPGFDTTGAQCTVPTPFAAAKSLSTELINLQIVRAPDGREVVLAWDAAANSASVVEFTESLSAPAWQTLTNFINGPTGARVTVRDTAAAPARVYRVRVDAAKP